MIKYTGKQIRMDKGYSTYELAEKAGMTHSSIYKWESGLLFPTLSSLCLVADALEVKPWQLIGYSDGIVDKKCAGYEKELQKLITKLTENKNSYISVADLTNRLIKADEYCNHKPWNLLQILSNINLIIPREIHERKEQ